MKRQYIIPQAQTLRTYSHSPFMAGSPDIEVSDDSEKRADADTDAMSNHRTPSQSIWEYMEK